MTVPRTLCGHVHCEYASWDVPVVVLPDGRIGGYAIEASCDAPGCSQETCRNLGSMCGFMPGSGDGCDGYFCDQHLTVVRAGQVVISQQCQRCRRYTQREAAC